MPITQVRWHLIEGVRALGNLLNMLEHAAAGCNLVAVSSSSWERIGFRLAERYWIGVVYDEPDWLCFQTEGCRINPQTARELGAGTVFEDACAPGGFVWRRTEELGSEQVHFYARSKASQIHWIEGFLMGSLEMANQFEMPV